jgi:hypothetical protein
LRSAQDAVTCARTRLATVDSPELLERLGELEETVRECRLLCGDQSPSCGENSGYPGGPPEDTLVWRSMDGALDEAVRVAHSAFLTLRERDLLAAEAARECEAALDLRRTILSALQPEPTGP